MRSPFPAALLVDLPNWVGDVVLAMPAVRALQRANRGGETVLLGPAGPAAVLGAAGLSTLERPGRAGPGWGRRALGGRWDVVLTTRHSTRAKALVAATGARRRLASRGRGATLLGLETFAIDRGRHQRHDFDLALVLLGVEPVQDRFEPIVLGDDEAAAGDRLLGTGGAGERVVALLPASRGNVAKRCPPARYAATAAWLRQRGVRPVVVVGPGEDELGRQVAGADAELLPPEMTLTEAAAVLGRCHAVAGNDSGLTHLAAALGRPTVAVFGPTDPGRTGPDGRVEVVRVAGAAGGYGWPSAEQLGEAVLRALGQGCAGRPGTV